MSLLAFRGQVVGVVAGIRGIGCEVGRNVPMGVGGEVWFRYVSFEAGIIVFGRLILLSFWCVQVGG